MRSDDEDMIAVAGGHYMMGSNRFYPDEGPRHRRVVAPFALDRCLVTNAKFAAFVAATGYVTTAEQPLDPRAYPHLGPDELAPGSVVFRPTDEPVDLTDWRQWWHWQPGANWRHPDGPGSAIEGCEDHPVVQISYRDALAYARWAGKRLPRESEFEFVAHDGHDAHDYAWGDERNPDGAVLANTWYGSFPYDNAGANGWRGRSPVGSFAPNRAGFVDLIGNVWEWTSSYYTPSHRDSARRAASRTGPASDSAVPSATVSSSCCAPPAGIVRTAGIVGTAGVVGTAGSLEMGTTPEAHSTSARSAVVDIDEMVDESTLAQASREPGSLVPRRVLKGGSYLCAPEYCLRYRPAARSPQAEDTATNHIGFRCARSLP